MENKLSKEQLEQIAGGRVVITQNEVIVVNDRTQEEFFRFPIEEARSNYNNYVNVFEKHGHQPPRTFQNFIMESCFIVNAMAQRE